MHINKHINMHFNKYFDNCNTVKWVTKGFHLVCLLFISLICLKFSFYVNKNIHSPTCIFFFLLKVFYTSLHCMNSFFFMAFLFTAVYRISNWRFMDLLLNGKSEYFVNKTYTKRMRREILPKSRRFLTIISTFVSSWSL